MTAQIDSSSHPRPQLHRSNWTSLNGRWDFCIGEDVDSITQTINVPFAAECAASGIEAKGYFNRVWYRRAIDIPNLDATEQLWLHFEAADYVTQVWVNGQFIGQHEGGYTRFSFEITRAVAGNPTAEILVRCDDDPHDLSKPRGKQDWLEQPHAIWYQRTTGLWQTVWLEVTPATRIANVRWTPNVADWTLRLDAVLTGSTQTNRVRLARPSAGSATRNSPTRTRKPTACYTWIARRKQTSPSSPSQRVARRIRTR